MFRSTNSSAEQRGRGRKKTLMTRFGTLASLLLAMACTSGDAGTPLPMTFEEGAAAPLGGGMEIADTELSPVESGEQLSLSALLCNTDNNTSHHFDYLYIRFVSEATGPVVWVVNNIPATAPWECQDLVIRSSPLDAAVPTLPPGRLEFFTEDPTAAASLSPVAVIEIP